MNHTQNMKPTNTGGIMSTTWALLDSGISALKPYLSQAALQGNYLYLEKMWKYFKVSKLSLGICISSFSFSTCSSIIIQKWIKYRILSSLY